jgi:UDP-MurNAc hydroxylase
MKMTWHSSACVSFESSGTKLLFDPWLRSPAFLGSWHQWPPPEHAHHRVLDTKFDFIVYTHFHSDHFDPAFLKEYLDKWSMYGHKPTILLAKNNWNQLQNSILNVSRGRAHVVLMDSARTFTLNTNGFEITSFVSDFCDPISCGKLIPCFSNNDSFRTIDSVAVLKDSDFSVVNFNDAISTNIDQHLQLLGVKADLVMGVFGAAGSFPQCMSNFSPWDKNAEKQKFIKKALLRLVEASDRLHSKYIFPFAGQYLLGGELSSLNDDRALIPANKAKEMLEEITHKEILTLATNQSAEFRSSEVASLGSEYIEPDSEVLRSYLNSKNIPYFYQKRAAEDVDVLLLYENLEKASARIAQRYLYLTKVDYSISIRTINSEVEWYLNFGEELSFGKKLQRTSDRYSQISMDLRLLDGVLKRKSTYKGFTSMHWNQAHIGSHLIFDQNEYESSAHYLLNFMHT